MIQDKALNEFSPKISICFYLQRRQDGNVKQARFKTTRKRPKIAQIQCFLFMEVDITEYFHVLKQQVSICKDIRMGMIFMTTYFHRINKISNRSQTAKNCPNSVLPFHGSRYYSVLSCVKMAGFYLQRCPDGNDFHDDLF